MKNADAVQILVSFLGDIDEEHAQSGKVSYPVMINENEVNAIKQLVRPHLNRATNKLLRDIAKMTEKDLQERKLAQENLIYKIHIGSTLYGTKTETSDEDFGGIFIPTKSYILGTKKIEQVDLSEKLSTTSGNQPGDTDFMAYGIIKFIKLAAENNPNIIEFFFVPKEHILWADDFGNRLREAYPLFISKETYKSFKGYAFHSGKK